MRRYYAIAAVILLLGAGLFAAWRFGLRDAPSAHLPAEVDWLAVLEGTSDEGFEPLYGPWQLTLPADHGAHAEARTESWIASAVLRTAAGEPIGVQLSLLRFALEPPGERRRTSAWATNEVYRGHVIFASGASERAVAEERFSRAAVGLAGNDAGNRRIWLEDWSLEYGASEAAGTLRIQGGTGDHFAQLELRPAKRPIAAGEDGDAPFRGYTLPRLEVSGTLRRAGKAEAVSGVAWLEHFWGELPLPVGPVVWDRFQLHLDDGSEVFVTRTRRRDGRGEPRVMGYRVHADGRIEAVDPVASRAVPAGDPWTDPRSGGRYPLAWQLTLGGLTFDIEPLIETQAHDFAAPVWSGAVLVRGRSGEATLGGTGFMELTGYGPDR